MKLYPTSALDAALLLGGLVIGWGAVVTGGAALLVVADYISDKKYRANPNLPHPSAFEPIEDTQEIEPVTEGWFA